MPFDEEPTSFARRPGHRWERGKPGSRRCQAPQHDLEALDLVAKSLYVTRTFMGLSPGGRMPPGHEHEAEKSDTLSGGYAKNPVLASRVCSPGGDVSPA